MTFFYIDFSYHQVSQLGTPEYTIDNEQSMLLDSDYNEYYMNSVDIHDNYSDESDYVGAHDLHLGVNLVGVCVIPEDNSIGNILLNLANIIAILHEISAF